MNRLLIIAVVFSLTALGAVALLINASEATAEPIENAPVVDDSKQPTVSAVMERLGKMPLAFTENVGQWNDEALFRASTKGTRIWFSEQGVCYQFIERIKNYVLIDNEGSDIITRTIQISCEGSNENAEYIGEGKLEFKSNYYIGNDPSEWREAVPSYQAVRCVDIYPGIDLKYYGSDESVEYDFIVSPGADPSQIVLKYDGIESLSLNEAGQLVVSTGWGDVVEERPVIYQFDGDSRMSVDGDYHLLSDNSLCFEIGDYDPNQSLVIDPLVSYLVYSTYLGGDESDVANGISSDSYSDGYVWVVGTTNSTDFPIAGTYAHQDTLAGSDDVFVTLMDENGNVIMSSYLGSPYQDFGLDVCCHASYHSVVIVGTARSGFPLIAECQSYAGNQDVFVSVLDMWEGLLISSTFLGGSSVDEGHGVEWDADDNITVVGRTYSSDFPTVDPVQGTYAGGGDAFVTTYYGGLISFGIGPENSTYLGGSDWDRAYGVSAVRVGGSGTASIFVTGYTESTDFPTVNAYQSTYAGGNMYGDAFVSCIDWSTSSFEYSTYLVGSNSDT